MHSADFAHFFNNGVRKLRVASFGVNDAWCVVKLNGAFLTLLSEEWSHARSDLVRARDDARGTHKRVCVVRHVATERALPRASSAKRYDNFGAIKLHVR